MSKDVSPEGAPWTTSKLFLRPDVPGQKELRTAMRWAAESLGLSRAAAQVITWRWLVEMHGEDEQ